MRSPRIHPAKSTSNPLPAALYLDFKSITIGAKSPLQKYDLVAYMPLIGVTPDPEVQRSPTITRSGARLPVHWSFRDQLPNPVSEAFRMDRLPP